MRPQRAGLVRSHQCTDRPSKVLFRAETSEVEFARLVRVAIEETGERLGEGSGAVLFELRFDTDDHGDELVEELGSGRVGKESEDVDNRRHDREFAVLVLRVECGQGERLNIAGEGTEVVEELGADLDLCNTQLREDSRQEGRTHFEVVGQELEQASETR